jgi:glyoxylase-like metal-dependent hydrolase (beta-lactamase superfamily II)
MQVSSPSDDIGNCYILRTKNGKVIVIDGGKNTDTQNLRNILTDKYGGIVDQWWISHPHGDHIGAFIDILENPQGIKIKEVYHSLQ